MSFVASCGSVEGEHSKVLGARVVNERLSPCYPERGVRWYNSVSSPPRLENLPKKMAAAPFWTVVSVRHHDSATTTNLVHFFHTHQQKPSLMACFAAFAASIAALDHQRKCKRAAPTDFKCIFSTSIALCTSSHAFLLPHD
eukprot:scaffold4459_cov117-Skeletonema_dohrnii-CCMP3373.AAC.4